MPSSVQESNKDGLMAAHEDIAGIDVVKGENNTRIIKLTDSKGKEAFITVNDHNQIIESI